MRSGDAFWALLRGVLLAGGPRRTDNLRGLVLYEPPIQLGDHELYPEAVADEMKRLLNVINLIPCQGVSPFVAELLQMGANRVYGYHSSDR